MPGRGGAQAGATAAGAGKGPLPPSIIVREVPMKDARSAQDMKERLDAMKAGGAFRETLPGPVPNTAVYKELQFLVAGNVLLVAGEPEKVERQIDAIRLLAYMAGRPRAHLQMNLRVVQITGPANAAVTQLSEAVQALVQAQRDEVVRTFGDLAEYLSRRLRNPDAPTARLVKVTEGLLPSLGRADRTPSIPETLLLLMLDRLATRMTPAARASGQDAAAQAAAQENEALREDLLALPRGVARLLADPHREPPETVEAIRPDLERWMNRVEQLRQRFHQYGNQLEKAKSPAVVTQLKESLSLPDGGVPDWIALRLSRSLEMTEQVFPNLVREQAIKTVAEFERRFESALKRGRQLQSELDQAESAHKAAGDAERRQRIEGRMTQTLVALKTLADSLAPPPMALFDQVGAVVEAVSPSAEQVTSLFRDYAVERQKLDARLTGVENSPPVNYARLQSLEAALNQWLRRASEALGRALEQQFYSQYTNELRLLANKSLGHSSDRDLLSQSSLYTVPDIVRDQLLSGSQANIFLSNSISLQFAPDTTNSVSAQVQQSLPSQRTLAERLQAATAAQSQLKSLNAVQGMELDTVHILGSLLAGGEPVPVRGGLSFTATPSIGYDGGTVSLILSTSQTLEPSGEKVADRVASHNISNATIIALSYEPMVLSTLASNTNYYEEVGGIPILRKVPVLKEALKDLPVTPFRTSKRQRGLVQASVLILEPIVIPTIEDLVRYQSGYRAEAGAP
jgi:hypothetical protein